MKLTIEGLEKERDFYFGKLRDVEVLAQENENVEGIESVMMKKVQVRLSFNQGFSSVPFYWAVNEILGMYSQ